MVVPDLMFEFSTLVSSDGFACSPITISRGASSSLVFVILVPFLTLFNFTIFLVLFI
jgi:hypothetical protein